jgi:uncharacterized protein YndB with AHSA1/START domain
MKLSARHDIDAPIADVFDALNDTTRWERAALRRGVEVQRKDAHKGLAIGAAWQVRASFRGKPRDVQLTLTTLEKPGRMVFSGDSNLFEGILTLDLIELSARRTRVTAGTEITAKTLAGRIMLQSLKLAKGRLDKRFAERVSATFGEIGTRLTRA